MPRTDPPPVWPADDAAEWPRTRAAQARISEEAREARSAAFVEGLLPFMPRSVPAAAARRPSEILFEEWHDAMSAEISAPRTDRVRLRDLVARGEAHLDRLRGEEAAFTADTNALPYALGAAVPALALALCVAACALGLGQAALVPLAAWLAFAGAALLRRRAGARRRPWAAL